MATALEAGTFKYTEIVCQFLSISLSILSGLCTVLSVVVAANDGNFVIGSKYGKIVAAANRI